MADGWVVDKGLNVLLAQINAAAPSRSKASDGSVGDPDHQARTSDHNPEPSAGDNPPNQVDARDFTHDPAHGADMAVVAESIRLSKDVRVRYVIWHDRIFYSTARNGYKAWAWQPHTGTYHHHLHVSVNDVHNDETQPWEIGIDMALSNEDLVKIWTHDLMNGPGKEEAYVVLNRAAAQSAEAVKLGKANAVAIAALQVPAPAPVDPAALKAVLLDPEVLKAIGEATVAATRAEYND